MYPCPQPNICHVRNHFDKNNCKARVCNSASIQHGRSVSTPLPSTSSGRVGDYSVRTIDGICEAHGVAEKHFDVATGSNAVVRVYEDVAIRIQRLDNFHKDTESEVNFILRPWEIGSRLQDIGAPVVGIRDIALAREEVGALYAIVVMDKVTPLESLIGQIAQCSDTVALLHDADVSQLEQEDVEYLKSEFDMAYDLDEYLNTQRKLRDNSDINVVERVVTHGDLHAENFALNKCGNLVLADLGSLSLSPRVVDVDALEAALDQEIEDLTHEVGQDNPHENVVNSYVEAFRKLRRHR